MNKYLILILFTNIIYSQVNYFDLKTLKESEIYNIESNFNSKKFTEAQKYTYSGTENDLAQPVSFIRNETENFPDAIVQYFYSSKDSIVKSIIFNWRLDIDKKDTQIRKIEKYNQAFEQLITAISKELGEPEPGQGNIQKKIAVVDDGSVSYERKVVWKVNTKFITATIIWAENHGEQMITSIK